MKKHILFLSLIPAVTMLAGCYEEETVKDQQTPYRIIQRDNGKSTVVDANGVPYVFRSTEFRSDLFLLADNCKVSDLKDYFELSKETGFNTIDLPFMWSEIEKEEGVYDYTDIETYLSFAKEFDLKLNIVWYGSFVDGQTHTANMPSYISKDTNKYSQLQFCYQSSIFGDCVIMDWTNSALKEKEANAIKALFNHIAAWNTSNDNYNPVIMLQCGQGLDRLQRYRVNQYDIIKDGSLLTDDYAKSLCVEYVSNVAKAAKASQYAPITRAEFCEQTSVTEYVKNLVKKAAKLDVVTTTYLPTVLTTRQGIRNFYDEYSNFMPIMNTENWANDYNARDALATYGAGGVGYTTFNLSSPLYYPMGSSPLPNDTNNLSAGALYKRKKSGESIKDKFEEEYTRATDIIAVNSLVSDISIPLANAKRLDIGLLGFDEKSVKELSGKQRLMFESGLLLENSSDNVTDYAYAIYDNNFLYFSSIGSGSLTFSRAIGQVASSGFFSEQGFWEKTNDVILEDNVTLSYEPNVLYRIRLGGLTEMTEKEIEAALELGYLSTFDSIKG